MSFLELDFCIGRVVLRQHQPNAFCFILSCSKKPFYRILQPPCEEDRQELLRYYSETEPVPKWQIREGLILGITAPWPRKVVCMCRGWAGKPCLCRWIPENTARTQERLPWALLSTFAFPSTMLQLQEMTETPFVMFCYAASPSVECEFLTINFLGDSYV